MSVTVGFDCEIKNDKLNEKIEKSFDVIYL